MSKCMVCGIEIDAIDGSFFLEDNIELCETCAEQYNNLTSENIYAKSDARAYFKKYKDRISNDALLSLIKKPKKTQFNISNSDSTIQDDDIASELQCRNESKDNNMNIEVSSVVNENVNTNEFEKPFISKALLVVAIAIWIGGIVVSFGLVSIFKSELAFIAGLIVYFVLGLFIAAASFALAYLAHIDYTVTKAFDDKK